MKLKKLWLIPLLFSATTAFAKVDVSPLFIQLSDAMAEMKKGEFAKSQQNLTALSQEFTQFENANSSAGQKVQEAIKQALQKPEIATLEQVAKDLYLFEKEQNPVDYRAKHSAFINQMTPLYQQLQQAVKSQNVANIKQAARAFGKTWSKSEKAVREISLTHYGKFERILGLIRIAVTAEKPDMAKIEARVTELGVVMTEFTQFEIK